MIISRTPVRISFFGGGTDYPVWLRERPGAVLSTTIDKYLYISCRPLPAFFEHRSRIVYSRTELVRKVSEIRHPAVRACLQLMRVREGIEIHHDGDLPARTGIGSSSAFTVGLLNSLNALRGRMISKAELAKKAILVEQRKLKEAVGCQDQVAAAYGGFNLIEFPSEREFRVRPMTLPRGRLEELQSHLLLVFTGLSRTASEIARKQIERTKSRKVELSIMHDLVYEAVRALDGGGDLSEFGRLLHETWKLKRTLTDQTSSRAIDRIYSEARRAGALGGKLLGAGGGGFMLFFARPDRHAAIRARLKKLLHVPFRFEDQGSQIIVYRPAAEY